MKPQIFGNKPELRKHVLSFLGSILIHAALVFILISYLGRVKIIDFKREVTPAFIAPLGKLELPKIEGTLPNPQDWGAQFPELGSRRRRPPRKPETPPEETGTPELAQKTPPGAPVDAKLTSGFNLKPTPSLKPRSTSEESQDFSLPLAPKTYLGSAAAKKSSSTSVDLRQYIYGGLPGGRGSSPGSYYGGRSGRGSIRSRTSAPPAVKNYDLSPWARGVVELIQKNWTVSSTQPTTSEDTVEIAVVILKNGEISTATIVSPSDDKKFDQVALEAVEASSPLPRLPGDFPAASLEVSLVFSKQ
jgi:TonB family protein